MVYSRYLKVWGLSGTTSHGYINDAKGNRLARQIGRIHEIVLRYGVLFRTGLGERCILAHKVYKCHAP